MKDHKFSCQNCDEPFEILLPAETTKASLTECEEDHPKYHNLTHVSECANCQQVNTIYYCTIGHPLRFTSGA
jgi:hypothetical protein